MPDPVPGLPQSALAAELAFVPVSFNRTSDRHPTPGDRISPDRWLRIAQKYGDKSLHRLPLRIVGRTSFERLCRVKASSVYMMAPDVERLFESSPPHRLIAKIINSIWRCSYRYPSWNDIVHTWNGLRSFSMGLRDFTVTVDHTTSCTPHGWATYSDTYLDGCLAFLIHYKGQHVLTVSFSIASGRRLLLRQVQACSPSGNRWLYKLPSGHLDFIIQRMRQAFPKLTLHIVSGEDLVNRSLANYLTSLERESQARKRHYREESFAAMLRASEKIKTLNRDKDRVVRFYGTAAKSASSGRPVKIQGLRHYRLEHSPP
ncbi:hypothetical protein AA14337_3111 [Acetobacter malorum DSM 14337]|uniref:Transposase n=1 Tax=Acetobacter malorum DSM 14337 TaxID=1307910 RepID=A0ABQ0PZQ1_9PROT|nr:hypothetical protein [Acetobacter malorum]KXV05692.1 hypothetical protein AD930_11200 [Acetobacter malorum]GBQ85586.1 hypothetical protein AA14337_3111 [Acetobacter malorum DSM 14337]